MKKLIAVLIILACLCLIIPVTPAEQGDLVGGVYFPEDNPTGILELYSGTSPHVSNLYWFNTYGYIEGQVETEWGFEITIPFCYIYPADSNELYYKKALDKNGPLTSEDMKEVAQEYLSLQTEFVINSYSEASGFTATILQTEVSEPITVDVGGEEGLCVDEVITYELTQGDYKETHSNSYRQVYVYSKGLSIYFSGMNDLDTYANEVIPFIKWVE